MFCFCSPLSFINAYSFEKVDTIPHFKLVRNDRVQSNDDRSSFDQATSSY